MQDLNRDKEEFNSEKQELHDERICEFGQAELENVNGKKIHLTCIELYGIKELLALLGYEIQER